MQYRFVNNSSNKLLKKIDRKLEADYRKQAEKNDKEKAYFLRQMEIAHKKKSQLRRIYQLEEDLHQLRIEHNALVERVNQNEMRCNQNKHDHDEEINEIKQRFEQYRIEIEQYRKTINETIFDLKTKSETLHTKQERLNRKQEEHGISIINLSLQRDTLNKLSQHLELIINARHSDLEKLDKFIEKLDDMKNSFNQIQEGFYLLYRIPFIEQEIQEIRNLIIHQNIVEQLELRISQIQSDITRHDDSLEQYNLRLDTLFSLYQKLKEIIKKSRDITDANDNSRIAVSQVKELRKTVIDISQKLNYLNEQILEVENIKLKLDRLELRFDDRLLILTDMEQRLNKLTNDLSNLKYIIDRLNAHPFTDPFKEKALEDYMKQVTRQIMESVSSLIQPLLGQINEPKILISILKTNLDEFLSIQQQTQPEIPSIMLPSVPSSAKQIRYIEPLKPIDLLQDIWK
ncbi:unnamed protein product [Rotaria sp. Silwood2]|nr:unnamed protein product [Rotaria sp. Silwood2]